MKCPKCGWAGSFEQGFVEYYDQLIDCSCPNCEDTEPTILAVVSYLAIREVHDQGDKVSKTDRELIQAAEQRWQVFDGIKLQETSKLPDIKEASFMLYWDCLEAGFKTETLIRHGDCIIFREPAFFEGYERYIEVAEILRGRYGHALLDLVPTSASEYFLYGDRIRASEIVQDARQRIFNKMI